VDPPATPPPPPVPPLPAEAETDEADETDEAPTTRRRRLSRVFAWVRNIGVIVVLFAAWQIWGTSVVEHHTQTELARQFQKDTTVSPGDDRPFGLLASTTAVTGPEQGSLMARLRIPAIGVDQYVVQGTSTGDLEKGPGHYRGTAVPGQAGNVAIAGHRTTFGAPFDRLDQLRRGEQIFLTTTAGETLTYAVSAPPAVVSPSDRAILDDFGDNRLTLSTSNPKYSAAQRLVVVARLDQPSVTGPSPTSGPPPGPLADTQTAGWNPGRLPVVALIVALLVLLALTYRRPSRRRVLVSLGVGAVWIAGLYLLFVALTNVLPATL